MISSAQITRKDKRGDQQFVPQRINNMPTLEQVRLHTKETLFPGYYEVTIHFLAKPAMKQELPKRQLFPSIDEPEAWASSSIEIVSSSGK